MLEILAAHQLNIMLFLSGICIITAVFVLLSNTPNKKRKAILCSFELGAAMLLLSDRATYIYNGYPGRAGYYLVRIANFTVFFFTLAVIYIMNLYLEDLLKTEAALISVPRRIIFNKILLYIGLVILILSQFFGIYYTFDSSNTYQRAPLFFICYIIPLVVMAVTFSLIVQYREQLSFRLSLSLILFSVVPILSSFIQMNVFGFSFINITIVGFAVVIYIFELVDTNEKVEIANRLEVENLMEQHEGMRRLFDETAKALVNAIEAKGDYMIGHSTRVADYARKIAEMSGKTEDECEEVYYAALLHDVGKIGIPESIVGKKSVLTEEEYERLKEHTLIGNQILSNISEYPFLSVGAYYHHERYDGKGYPDGVKGNKIPEIARMIAVADAYDTMRYSNMFGEAMSAEQAREELISCAGSQFDPEFAKTMVHIIDMDVGHSELEKDGITKLAEAEDIHFAEYRDKVMHGIELTDNVLELSLKSVQDEEISNYECVPALIVFDSVDGRVHSHANTIKEMDYEEYGEVWFDGHALYTAARKMRVTTRDISNAGNNGDTGNISGDHGKPGKIQSFSLEAVKYSDHIMINIYNDDKETEVILALPDSTRSAYIGLTGEHCKVSDIYVRRSNELIKDGYIPRIAKEISYVNRMEGDLPNLQINGFRSNTTEGVPVFDGMRLIFHTMSLPSSKMTWNCPMIVIFYSADSMVYGEEYREYALISLDGEKRNDEGHADIQLEVQKSSDFKDWDDWKENNKKGYECTVDITQKRNRIILSTANFGVNIRCRITITDGTKEVYAALTGDQCALTDIRII
ncbi:MAG: HD domain-containing protein [Lachnospiraceae bacterium]|nr:HD domain-containing protein [Lachnospiraceae bacterium]